MKKVTVRMVGEAAGVSHATVSRVLNNDPRVHPETRERVIATAQKLGYRLESGGGRRVIALILPMGALGGYMGRMLIGLRDEIGKRGYHTELVARRDIGILNDRIVAGAVSLSVDDILNEKWKELRNLPLVRVNRGGSHFDGIYTVRSDGLDAMEQAIDYLWLRGHRRIAFAADTEKDIEPTLCSRRFEGFVGALVRRGCLEPKRFVYFNLWHELPDFRRMVDEGVTALICGGESTGAFVMRGCYLSGVRIPDELSVIGMEYDPFSRLLCPPQTTLAQDYSALSFHALELLDQLMRGETPAGDVTIPYELIERESVKTIIS